MLYTLKEHEEKQLIPKDSLEERVGITGVLENEKVKVLEESAKGKKARKLIVKMEAIHVGKTRNSTFYTEEGLKGGLKSWTQPYNKPVLTHHNAYDGEPIGRILEAEYSDQTLSGKSGLLFTVEVTDPDAIEKVLDGRYQTVSIGATTDKVTCNICGTDRTEEWCEHYPGRKYDEQDCHFIIGNTYGREVSYVNTPSDVNAGNISVKVEDENSNTNESVNMQIYQMAEGLYQDANNPDVNLYENLNEDVKKMLDSMTSVKEGSEEKVPPKEDLEQNQENKDQKTDKEPKDNLDEGKQDDPVTDTKENELDEKDPVNTLQEGFISVNEQEYNDLKEKVVKLQESVSNYVLDYQKLESKMSTLESENNQLVQEKADLLEEAHRALAEKVVDLKLKLNKADVIGTTPEEAVSEHIKRTKESLEDSLKDLLSESKKKEMPEPGSVKNPGLAKEDPVNEGEEKLSLNEAIDLMTGMFSRKK